MTSLLSQSILKISTPPCLNGFPYQITLPLLVHKLETAKSDPEPVHSDTELKELLRSVAGLDLETAERIVPGDLQNLYRYLTKFDDSHRDDGKTMIAQLQAEDFEAARKMAHTLKGVTGMLGFMTLHNLSTEFDALIKARGDQVDKNESTRLAQKISADLDAINDSLSEVHSALNQAQELDPA